MKIATQIKNGIQETYPELYLPYKIEEYLCADSLKPKEPEAPEKPVKEELPTVSGIIVLLIAFVSFALLYKILDASSLLNSASTIISLFASFALGAIAYQKIIDIKQKPVIEKNNEEERIYKLKNEQYHELLRQYEKDLNKYNLNKENEEYRNICIKDYFTNNEVKKDVINQHDDVKEGASESYFKKYLRSYLGDNYNFEEKGCLLKIQEGLKIEYYPELLPDREYEKYDEFKSYFYYPDIVVTDGKGFYMDIEIDEMYTLDNHNPIHYLEVVLNEDNNQTKRSSDYIRNREFTYAGWIVIRFSETQIVNNPRECARAICDIYNCIFDYKKFGNYEWPVGLVESKWDLSTSLKNARENTREILLKDKVHNNIVAYF